MFLNQTMKVTFTDLQKQGLPILPYCGYYCNLLPINPNMEDCQRYPSNDRWTYPTEEDRKLVKQTSNTNLHKMCILF
jgi:hypothetical protein